MKIKVSILILLWCALASVNQLVLADSSSQGKNYDKEIEEYFQSQEIKPQNGEVEHPDHGRVAATSEAYLLDYTQCQNKVFADKKFTFGNIVVSEPEKLKRFSMDFHINLMVHQLPDSSEKHGLDLCEV